MSCNDPIKLDYEALVAIINAINEKVCVSEITTIIDEKVGRCITVEEVTAMLRVCGDDEEEPEED